MNQTAEINVADHVAFRRVGVVILTMCGITVGLIVAAVMASHLL